jgi:hypothetical protein
MGDTATTGEMPLVSVTATCDGDAPDGVVADCVGLVAGAGAAAAGLAAGLPACAHTADADIARVAINVAAPMRRPIIKEKKRVGKREFVIGKSGVGESERGVQAMNKGLAQTRTIIGRPARHTIRESLSGSQEHATLCNIQHELLQTEALQYDGCRLPPRTLCNTVTVSRTGNEDWTWEEQLVWN